MVDDLHMGLDLTTGHRGLQKKASSIGSDATMRPLDSYSNFNRTDHATRIASLSC